MYIVTAVLHHHYYPSSTCATGVICTFSPGVGVSIMIKLCVSLFTLFMAAIDSLSENKQVPILSYCPGNLHSTQKPISYIIIKWHKHIHPSIHPPSMQYWRLRTGYAIASAPSPPLRRFIWPGGTRLGYATFIWTSRGEPTLYMATHGYKKTDWTVGLLIAITWTIVSREITEYKNITQTTHKPWLKKVMLALTRG